MRMLAMTAIFVAAATGSAAAAVQQAQQQAQAQDAQQDRQENQQQVQVQVQGDGNDGQAVRIGVGRLELENAPPDVKKKLEEARAAAEKQDGEARKAADRLDAAKAKADEAQKAIDRLKKQIEQGQQQGPGGVGFGMQGSITIIGPDGVKHTQKFEKFGNGDGPMPDVQQLIEKAMQAAGADLPDDVRDKLKQALKQQGNMQMQMQFPGGMKPKGDEADISRKLDRILDRLEKLEEDVGEIKGRKAGKPDKAKPAEKE